MARASPERNASTAVRELLFSKERKRLVAAGWACGLADLSAAEASREMQRGMAPTGPTIGGLNNANDRIGAMPL
jgi:hypothetical protein